MPTDTIERKTRIQVGRNILRKHSSGGGGGGGWGVLGLCWGFLGVLGGGWVFLRGGWWFWRLVLWRYLASCFWRGSRVPPLGKILPRRAEHPTEIYKKSANSYNKKSFRARRVHHSLLGIATEHEFPPQGASKGTTRVHPKESLGLGGGGGVAGLYRMAPSQPAKREKGRRGEKLPRKELQGEEGTPLLKKIRPGQHRVEILSGSSGGRHNP